MTTTPRWDFASDNSAPLQPGLLAAITAANHDFTPGYGEDEATRASCDAFRAFFACDCDVFFVHNGTAANALALATLCRSYHAIVAAPNAHIETDECGAPELFSGGAKILLTEDATGKVSAGEVRRLVTRRSDIHYPKPRAVTLTQSTELGTIYAVEEVRTVCAEAHALGLRVHMDGARFANAVAALGCSAADATWRAGVDVLSFGGTKAGFALAEAVVFFDRTLSTEFAWRCKQAGQLCSKMRFLAAPWGTALSAGTWLDGPRHANAMAARLAARLKAAGIAPMHPVQANAVFLSLPETVHSALAARGWRYYRFIGGGARLMCSWATDPAAVEALADDIALSVAAR